MAAATPWRDDPGTTTEPPAVPTRACPVCPVLFVPVGRQVYCSTACRKRAFRRRHGLTPPPLLLPGTGRRERTVFECDDCGNRQLGEQRCGDCGTFARSAGLGGHCPSCDEPITMADLGLQTGATR